VLGHWTVSPFDRSLLQLPAGLPTVQNAGISFTQWSKNGFLGPQGRNFAPINVKFGTREWPLVRFPMPNSTSIGAEVWEYSPKQSKLQFCQQICSSAASHLHSFYDIFSVCTRLCVAYVFNLVAFERQTTKL